MYIERERVTYVCDRMINLYPCSCLRNMRPLHVAIYLPVRGQGSSILSISRLTNLSRPRSCTCLHGAGSHADPTLLVYGKEAGV